MAEFPPAVTYLLKNEGGLEEDAKDPGGITNFGISLRFLRQLDPLRLRGYGIFEPIDEHTIRNLSEAVAIRIYQGEWWSADPYDMLKDQQIATYMFDFAVNAGVTAAIKAAQRAIIDVLLNQEMGTDGILGPDTLHFINTMETPVFMAAYRAECKRRKAP